MSLVLRVTSQWCWLGMQRELLVVTLPMWLQPRLHDTQIVAVEQVRHGVKGAADSGIHQHIMSLCPRGRLRSLSRFGPIS